MEGSLLVVLGLCCIVIVLHSYCPAFLLSCEYCPVIVLHCCCPVLLWSCIFWLYCLSLLIKPTLFPFPGPLSYSDAVQTGIPPSPDAVEQSNHVLNPTDESTSLCPYAVHGNCPFGGECAYVHGNICEFCGKATLVPSDELQNKKHTEVCIHLFFEFIFGDFRHKNYQTSDQINLHFCLMSSFYKSSCQMVNYGQQRSHTSQNLTDF